MSPKPSQAKPGRTHTSFSFFLRVSQSSLPGCFDKGACFAFSCSKDQKGRKERKHAVVVWSDTRSCTYQFHLTHRRIRERRGKPAIHPGGGRERRQALPIVVGEPGDAPPEQAGRGGDRKNTLAGPFRRPPCRTAAAAAAVAAAAGAGASTGATGTAESNRGAVGSGGGSGGGSEREGRGAEPRLSGSGSPPHTSTRTGADRGGGRSGQQGPRRPREKVHRHAGNPPERPDLQLDRSHPVPYLFFSFFFFLFSFIINNSVSLLPFLLFSFRFFKSGSVRVAFVCARALVPFSFFFFLLFPFLLPRMEYSFVRVRGWDWLTSYSFFKPSHPIFFPLLSFDWLASSSTA